LEIQREPDANYQLHREGDQKMNVRNEQQGDRSAGQRNREHFGASPKVLVDENEDRPREGKRQREQENHLNLSGLQSNARRDLIKTLTEIPAYVARRLASIVVTTETLTPADTRAWRGLYS
jgi:hypothetical protein